MRLRVSAALMLVCVVVLSACDQDMTTTKQDFAAPQSALLDGSSGGNPHFFFLPPLVDKPKSMQGEFNPDLAPTVEICTDLQLDANGSCESLLVRFARFPGAGDEASEQVKVAGNHYALNWQTRKYAVPQNTPFRVIVRVGTTQLGFIDLIRNGNNYSTYTTSGKPSNLGNGTITIKFVIERGALCVGATECLEATVGPDGGTFVIERADGTKPAGTEFPAGALEENVTLIIERYLGECLPTDVPQYQGCYRFRTEPHVENFELPATVGVCLFDPSAFGYFETNQLRLWKWSEVEGDPIVELERVTIDYLECPDLALGSLSGSPLMLGAARAASVVFKPLASLLLPREAYAMAPYEGGKLINFSRVGWVRPLAVEIKDGDGQTGTAGQALPVKPTVRVINKYGDFVEGVPGFPVTFTPSGDGSAVPPTISSNSDGEAATTWTLATTPGANTLLARAKTSRPIAPVPYEAEALLHATGNVAQKLVWLRTLVDQDDMSGTLRVDLSPTVEVRTLSGELVFSTTAELWPGMYYAEWHFTSLPEGQTYRITVMLDGEPMGHIDLRVVNNELRNAETNTVVAWLDFETRARIKFRILE